MISLQRQRSVQRVHANFRNPKRIELARKLLEDQRRIKRGEIDKHPFDSDIWKKAKEQLHVETINKCAYCEAPTAAVAYGDVEHYRPKSIYWWLAYSLENYLVSCTLCNQRFKKDKFPIDGPKWRAPRVAKNTTDIRLSELAGTIMPDPLVAAEVTQHIANHDAERPLLVNPYVTDPEPLFTWRPDYLIEEVELIPNPAAPNSDRFVSHAEKLYGLNRLELKQLRYFFFDSYRIHKMSATALGFSAAVRAANVAMVARMMNSDRPFAGMIRYFEAIGGPPPSTTN